MGIPVVSLYQSLAFAAIPCLCLYCDLYNIHENVPTVSNGCMCDVTTGIPSEKFPVVWYDREVPSSLQPLR